MANYGLDKIFKVRHLISTFINSYNNQEEHQEAFQENFPKLQTPKTKKIEDFNPQLLKSLPTLKN